jgi:sodium/potassium-transporting ATPase subunit alpha
MGPGLALIKETAEKDVMLRRPRKKTSHLVGPSTFIHAYLYIGLFESFGALTMYFLYMWNYAGFSLSSLFFAFDKYSAGFGGRTQGELTEILYTAQCVYFVAVVVIQAGNTLGTRTQYLSLFQHNPLRGPGRNWYLFLAISISVALAAIVVYIPPLNTALGTRPIPFEFWFLPLGWTVGLILLDELRKLAVRRIRKTRGM